MNWLMTNWALVAIYLLGLLISFAYYVNRYANREERYNDDEVKGLYLLYSTTWPLSLVFIFLIFLFGVTSAIVSYPFDRARELKSNKAARLEQEALREAERERELEDLENREKATRAESFGYRG